MFRNCNCSYNNLSSNTDTNSSTSNNMYEESCNMIQNYNYGNIENDTTCSCGFTNTSAFPQNWMYGHCYVPHQRMNQIYTPEIGLKMGTIFPELVSPYCPNQSLETINYLKNSNTIGGGCNS